MDPKAWHAAKEMLELAARRADKMALATDLTELRYIWSEFLVDFNRFFTKLRKGAERGPAKGWSDRIEHSRRTDDLLSYLTHARNADEHGIANIAEIQPGEVTIGSPQHVLLRDYGKPLWIDYVRFTPGGIDLGPEAAKLKVEVRPASVALLSVVDRGRTYHPPRTHLGMPIPNVTPAIASKLALDFARGKLEESRQFLPSG